MAVTLPPRDFGVRPCEAALFLRVSRKTIHKYLNRGYVRRYGKSRQVSCASLGVYTGSKETPEIILAQVLAAKPTPTPDI